MHSRGTQTLDSNAQSETNSPERKSKTSNASSNMIDQGNQQVPVILGKLRSVKIDPKDKSAALSHYVRLNIGGTLHCASVATLTKHDSMLRAMFSGRMELATDMDGWVMIDRSGVHFATILNYLRDDTVQLPDCRQICAEILAEARYYCLDGLVHLCVAHLDHLARCQKGLDKTQMLLQQVCRVPVVSMDKEKRALLAAATQPVVTLLLNRHNNKYSYTSQSDDNLLKNMELFDKLLTRFSERIMFIKDVGAANEVCSWTFYGGGRKVAEVCCTSIVYATDKKHTKVEFPEARIYEEAMNILLYENGPDNQTSYRMNSAYSNSNDYGSGGQNSFACCKHCHSCDGGCYKDNCEMEMKQLNRSLDSMLSAPQQNKQVYTSSSSSTGTVCANPLKVSSSCSAAGSRSTHPHPPANSSSQSALSSPTSEQCQNSAHSSTMYSSTMAGQSGGQGPVESWKRLEPISRPSLAGFADRVQISGVQGGPFGGGQMQGSSGMGKSD